jgi:predicted RNA-binding Zn-ribbon protein involved in translation (DUF1610 family)
MFVSHFLTWKRIKEEVVATPRRGARYHLARSITKWYTSWAMDLLEEAGIPPPPPPIITAEDRAALAGVAMAQRQMYYCLAFAGGLLGVAVIDYLIGYHDEIADFVKWLFSGTGMAVALSLLNTQRLARFKCPRCGENFFGKSLFGKQCQYCGLPLHLHDDDLATDAVTATRPT